MAHDPVKMENTRAWFIRAIDDLDVADHDLRAAPPFVRAALFHCQQAIKKALKGFLTWHDEPFPKTHELRFLGERCIRLEPNLKGLLEPAFPLTEYAWKFRYPGPVIEPTAEVAETSLQVAHNVMEKLIARLPGEVRDRLGTV